MGVDIYGISPKLRSEKPEINYEMASEKEKEGYWKIADDWEKENPGYYFRSNWWGWRPIHVLADIAINVAELPFTTKGWGGNNGHGLKTQEDCDLLADAMELVLLLNKKNVEEDTDKIYICLGSWVTSDGRFVSNDEKLNEDYPSATILYSGVISGEGELVFPAHSASLSLVKEFITFLRECGGFEIH